MRRSWPTPPLARIRSYAFAGLSPARMGLGPVFASAQALAQARLELKDCQLFEINEAFAAQVLACLEAARSATFARDELGRDRALGEIPAELLNVNGGAIALGHPVGASGARLLLTLALEMRRRGFQRGLASAVRGRRPGRRLHPGALTVEIFRIEPAERGIVHLVMDHPERQA